MRTLMVRGEPFYVHDGEDISNDIFRRGDYFESPILDYICDIFPVQKTILDIGAMIGNHTNYFARFFQYEQIIAFEPMPEHFELLQRNADFPNVTLHQLAVSNYCGKAVMERHSFNWGMHGIKYPTPVETYWNIPQYVPEGQEIVDCVTLDSLEIKDVTLMKIDVEMHEPMVFEGAAQTIREFKPLIMLEDCYKQYDPIMRDFGYVKIASWEANMEYLYQWEG